MLPCFCLQVTIRDINDNAPTFDTAENVGIPDTAVVGDIVAYIRVSCHTLMIDEIVKNYLWPMILVLCTLKTDCGCRFSSLIRTTCLSILDYDNVYVPYIPLCS